MATTPAQTSAIAWFRSLLSSWGIAELVPDAQKLILQGLGADAVTLQLQETDAYKKRFAGNEIRRKKGLAVLSPAEYVANETSYAQVLRQFGLPKGFYDSRDDYTKWIAADVSPAELAERATEAQDLFFTGPEENRRWWLENIGGTVGEAIAGILDPAVAEPLVKRRVAAARIGGGALGQGLAVGQAQAEYFAGQGVTAAQARAGYTDIAQALPVDQAIAQRFGTSIGQAEEEAAVFGGAGAADAEEKKRRLAASEAGLFGGRPGADSSSLSRSTVGSY